MSTHSLSALKISEIMSNPPGADDGREWIEVYNETPEPLDLSSLTISIKGGAPVSVIPLQGGTSIQPGSYAIISSSVSSQSRFLQDYPTFSLPLFRSTISLVNTGVTSIDIRLHGTSVDALTSYTAAKEGSSLSRVGGAWVTGPPSPGAENSSTQESSSSVDQTAGQSTESNQNTLTQMSPPSADIVLYVPFERTVVAGADTIFDVSAQTKAGKAIPEVKYSWAFGDGGSGVGSSTIYRYAYPGHYIAQVEGRNSSVFGVASTRVLVVAPEVALADFGEGKYGAYLDVVNMGTYDIDISGWKVSIDGALFLFPNHTRIGGGRTTRISGSAMGFSTSSLSTYKKVTLLFPNNEIIATLTKRTTTASASTSTPPLQSKKQSPPRIQKVVPLAQEKQASTTHILQKTKPSQDIGIANFIKTFLSR